MKKMKAVFFVAFLLVTTTSVFALIDPETKKQKLVTCTVTSGTVVTQVGNTCDPDGQGCTANPCNQ